MLNNKFSRLQATTSLRRAPVRTSLLRCSLFTLGLGFVCAILVPRTVIAQDNLTAQPVALAPNSRSVQEEGKAAAAGGKQSESKPIQPPSVKSQSDQSQPDKTQPDKTQADQSEAQEIELPWERKRENKIPRLTKLNERELLADVTEEEFLSVRDYLPINLKQHLFAKLLFRVRQIGLDNFARLAKVNSKVGMSDLESEPGFHRFKIIRVAGKARAWEKRKLSKEVGELFDLFYYYKVKITTESNHNIIYYCHSIPEAWKENQQLAEDVTFEGLFVNTTLSKEKTLILNFIGDRIRWSPQSASPLVNQIGWSLLGSAGFDLGLLDALATRNKKRLDKADTETFYQMLAAAKLLDHSRNTPDWQSEVPRFELIEVLKAPSKHHGELRLIRAEIRNVTTVKVEQDYIKDRVGIDQYFQLDGFVEFDSSVTYKGEGGKEGAVFKDKYPISICVNELPPGWKQGSDQRYAATFPVFFFKIWAFPSGFQAQFSRDALQQSPLLIGLQPIQVRPVSSAVSWATIGLFTLFGVGFISIWTAYFIGRARKDRNATQFRMPSSVDSESMPEVESPTGEQANVSGMPIIKESTDS